MSIDCNETVFGTVIEEKLPKIFYHKIQIVDVAEIDLTNCIALITIALGKMGWRVCDLNRCQHGETYDRMTEQDPHDSEWRLCVTRGSAEGNDSVFHGTCFRPSVWPLHRLTSDLELNLLVFYTVPSKLNRIRIIRSLFGRLFCTRFVARFFTGFLNFIIKRERK